MKRFLYLLPVYCFLTLFLQQADAQTVNRKLYLKSGNLLDRTVGSTKVNSGTFSKTGAVKDGSSSFVSTASNQAKPAPLTVS
ncbi:MAG: hypothetical protein ACKOZZ_07115, partial [Bacteroidota bacterium]